MNHAPSHKQRRAAIPQEIKAVKAVKNHPLITAKTPEIR